jgi:hypothetical protein
MTMAHGQFVLVVFFVMLLLIGVILLAALVTLAGTVAQIWRERREKRSPPWRVCRKCGYNVIASRVRCPECGNPIPEWPKDEPRIRIVRGVVIVERQRRPDQWRR